MELLAVRFREARAGKVCYHLEKRLERFRARARGESLPTLRAAEFRDALVRTIAEAESFTAGEVMAGSIEFRERKTLQQACERAMDTVIQRWCEERGIDAE